MKNTLTVILFFFALGSARAQKQNVKTFQLMKPGFNTKEIGGTISEVYTTQRYGKTFWWVKIGKDTILHVWYNDLDTATMKVGVTRKFYSIKRLDGNLWKKEKSEGPIK